MKSMFWNDDDEESGQTNWKNSEIMRNFVVELEAQQRRTPVTAAPSKQEELPPVPQPDLQKIAVVEANNAVVEELKALAERLDEVTAYTIERAIGEIQSIAGDPND